MLTGISLYNERNVFIMTLPVFGANLDSRYIVKDVDGLDPVKAQVATSESATFDGVHIQNTRAAARNIVMTLGFNPNVVSGESAASLRRELYFQFPPKGRCTLRFHSDDFETVRIVGYVESMEAKLFSREPEMMISILCPDPYFSALNSLTHSTVNTFEFRDLPGMGSAPTGFVFKTDPLKEAIDAVVLENGLDRKIDIVGPFITNDIVTVSTVPGNKYARRTRTGSTVSILDDIVSGDLGMSIDGRTPSFRFSTRQSGGGLNFDMTYTPKFIGL